MFPYWLLFSVFAVGALASRDRMDWRYQATPLFASAGLLIVLMVGLRYEVGGDWGAYQRMFESFRWMKFDQIFSLAESEPAYSLVNWLMLQFGLGIWAVNLACGAIFAWGLVTFVRRQPQPWLALLAATPFLIIVVAMGYTRQSAAIGLFLLALAALGEQRSYRAILLICLAATFHRSALITLPLVGLSYTRNRVQVALLGAVMGVFVYYTLVAPQLDRYTHAYLEQEYEAEGAWVRLLMNAVPAVLFMLMIRKRLLDPIDRKLWTNISLLALVSFGLVFFTNATVALDRLALYIIPLQMFVFSRLPGLFSDSRTSALIITLLVILYSAAVQFIWLNYAVHAEYWIPYRTVLTAEP